MGLTEFCAQNVRAGCVRSDRKAPSEASAHADAWDLSLSVDGRTETFPFFLGRAHGGREPKAEEVLADVVSDTLSISGSETFEEWCSEVGFDSDSLRAFRCWKSVKLNRKKLHRLFGSRYGALVEAYRESER